MSENTKIEWCDHSFNGWEGCTKVSAGCAHCYAEARDKRFTGGLYWGKGAPRRRTSEANWKLPLRWNKIAGCFPANPRPRIFCSSLADWLDDEVPIEWLCDLLNLTVKTPNLDWLLLSKRPENWRERLIKARGVMFADPLDVADHIDRWLDGIPWNNVWIGTTVENQEMANKRIPELLTIPAKIRFLSCEPLLGLVTIPNLTCRACGGTGEVRERHDFCMETVGCMCQGEKPIHWIICGGESGPRARPMHPAWARSLRDQCEDAGVAYLFKQWGEWAPDDFGYVTASGNTPKRCWMNEAGKTLDWRGTYPPNNIQMLRYGKASSGRLLDGREWNEFPKSGGRA